VFKCERVCGRVFKIRRVLSPPTNKKRGDIVSSQDNQFFEAPAFSTEDILWALGVWTVILALSPVIVFYLLMVN
jgi:hypothetical protein